MYRVFPIKERIACITLDFETDYGDRIGNFNILEANRKEMHSAVSNLGVPLSIFIRTDLLDDNPSCLGVVTELGNDFHSHSHTHATKGFISTDELSRSANVFDKHFGYPPLGYRAPQGVLYEMDITLLKEIGYKFSSSVFPSYRPGKFNNLSAPITPFQYDNNIVEMPFAVVPLLRLVVSISYFKLLGYSFYKILFSICGLPNVLILDSHLHDLIINEDSFDSLPLHLRMAWGRNKYAGLDYLYKIISYLKKEKYNFLTMTELFHLIEAEYL